MGKVAGLRQAWKGPGESMDGEAVPFEGFFEDQKERLLRILSVITGSRAEAEDLAQEAFTRVFERWESVAAMEDPAGYLHRRRVARISPWVSACPVRCCLQQLG
jgi:DNA-directed RNA polymerase specialized sigma24 family protein